MTKFDLRRSFSSASATTSSTDIAEEATGKGGDTVIFRVAEDLHVAVPVAANVKTEKLLFASRVETFASTAQSRLSRVVRRPMSTVHDGQ